MMGGMDYLMDKFGRGKSEGPPSRDRFLLRQGFGGRNGATEWRNSGCGETRREENMPFCETNPPFCDQFFVVSDYANDSCE
jgi:hypothetical protein